MLFVLQTYDLKGQMTRHQSLSRSSSETSQPTFESTHTPDRNRSADRCHTEENTPEHDQTNTDHDEQTQNSVADQITHTQNKAVGRDAHDEAKVEVYKVKARDNKKDANMEPVEREEESTDLVR